MLSIETTFNLRDKPGEGLSMKDADSRNRRRCKEPSLEKHVVGGFVMIYHDIEEISYGPELGFSANARVLLCIRHKLLRDGLCEKIIGKKFIIEKTGLDARQIERAVKYWEKREYIIVTRTKTGKVWHENSYQLDPKKFGHLYNHYKNNTTVRTYNGSKGRSYSKKGIPELPIPLPADLRGGVPADLPGGKQRKLLELLAEIESKNPSSKNPKEKNPSSEDFKFSGSGKKRQQQMENPEEERERQLEAARKAGIL